MLDTEYIEELRGMEAKDAKEALAQYAKTFDIVLKKTRSFDNMVADLEEGLKAISEEPMPEDNEGLSITDLIDEVPEEEKPSLLIDSIGCPIGTVTTVFEDGTTHTYEPKGLTEEDLPRLKEAVQKIVESEAKAKEEVIKEEPAKFVLPENFHPKHALMGRAPGYMTLPWWIYQFILENEDWKDRPLDFPHPSAHNTLLTLIYYINRDGLVNIRETRNSRFVTLK